MKSKEISECNHYGSLYRNQEANDKKDKKFDAKADKSRFMMDNFDTVLCYGY